VLRAVARCHRPSILLGSRVVVASWIAPRDGSCGQILLAVVPRRRQLGARTRSLNDLRRGRRLASARSMTLPRLVLSGRTLLVTRRCFSRMFLLRPSAQVQAVFTYCLALAAEKYGIQVHAAIVLGNHWHAALTDPGGRLPAFMRWLHTNVAKALNVHHRRGESFWAPGSYSAVTLGDGAAVLDKLAYVITNAVAAGLVSTPAEWPGLRTLAEDVGARVLEGARPGSSSASRPRTTTTPPTAPPAPAGVARSQRESRCPIAPASR
jgi:hypothetical protein